MNHFNNIGKYSFTSDYISSCKYYFCLIGRSSQLLTIRWVGLYDITSKRLIAIPPLRHREKLSYQGPARISSMNKSCNNFSWFWFFKTTFLWLLKVVCHIYNPELGQDPRKSFSLHLNEWDVSYAKIYPISLEALFYIHLHLYSPDNQKKFRVMKF